MAELNQMGPWVSPRALEAARRAEVRDLFEITMSLTEKCGFTPVEGAEIFRMELENPQKFQELVGALLIQLAEEPAAV